MVNMFDIKNSISLFILNINELKEDKLEYINIKYNRKLDLFDFEILLKELLNLENITDIIHTIKIKYENNFKYYCMTLTKEGEYYSLYIRENFNGKDYFIIDNEINKGDKNDLFKRLS